MNDNVDASLLLAHNSTFLLDGLSSSLEEAGLNDIRRAGDLPSATAQLHRRPARLTLCGSELAGTSVGDMVAELLQQGAASVVVLAPTVDEHDLLEALEAGALGYVTREQSLDRLVYDVHGALHGEACLPRDKLASVLRLLIERRREVDERSVRLSRLSKREAEVLTHLANGAANAQIAGALFLSQATVRTHVQNILAKLGVHSRLEAIALTRPPRGSSDDMSTQRGTQ